MENKNEIKMERYKKIYYGFQFNIQGISRYMDVFKEYQFTTKERLNKIQTSCGSYEWIRKDKFDLLEKENLTNLDNEMIERLLKDLNEEMHNVIKSDDVNAETIEQYIFNDIPTVMYKVYESRKIDLQKTDEKLVVRMQLIYLFTIIDSFIIDSIRVLLENDNNLLRNKKQLEFEEIIELGSYEKLLDVMITKELQKIGYNSIADKIDKLQELKVYNFDKETRKEMIMFNEYRNAIIHNKGTINQINIDKVKKALKNSKEDLYNLENKIKKGENIPENYDYLKEIYDVCVNLADNIFKGVNNKINRAKNLELL